MQQTDNGYKYIIDECDVSDKESLEKFREKHSEWVKWFGVDDTNTIANQIYSMMWGDAAYRSLAEAYRFSSADKPTAHENEMLAELLYKGYLANQMLAIGKLIDRDGEVISLGRLFDEINKNRRLFTRENFVSHDGLPYDYAKVQEAEFEQCKPGEARWGHTKGPKAYGTSESMHKAFDEISGVAPDNRCRKDLIAEDVFEQIERLFGDSAFGKIKTYRDKFIAHAASQKSRRKVQYPHHEDLIRAHEKILKITRKVADILGTGIGNPVPIAQYDVFENLDKPLIPSSKIKEMTEWWQKHRQERNSWY